MALAARNPRNLPRAAPKPLLRFLFFAIFQPSSLEVSKDYAGPAAHCPAERSGFGHTPVLDQAIVRDISLTVVDKVDGLIT
jgi:hypothetical protein